MTDTRWVDRTALVLLHSISLTDHGGSPGLRDEGLLDSALSRRRNLAAYGEPDLSSLAAAYGFGLAKNHPFVDGNRRTAFLAIGLFLDLNGFALSVDQAEAVDRILALAAGDLSEEDLADWIRRNVVPATEAPSVDGR